MAFASACGAPALIARWIPLALRKHRACSPTVAIITTPRSGAACDLRAWGHGHTHTDDQNPSTHSPGGESMRAQPHEHSDEGMLKAC
jgi:hypothetical protein